MSKAVVVSGAAGFLGSHLVEHYLKLGFTVFGIDNFSTGMKTNVEIFQNYIDQKKYYFFKADACLAWDSFLPSEVIQSFDVPFIFHFASPASPPLYQSIPLETIEINTTGLLKALNFADSTRSRVIFASTSEVYGDPAVSPQPESYWGNVNSFGERACYDESKRLGEAIIFSYNKIKGTKHGMVRIFNTYGPRMNPTDGRVIINFLKQAIENKPLTIYGDGQQTRSFCFVSDLIAAITRYAETDITFPINTGNTNEFKILDLVQNIQKLFPEKKLTIEFHGLPADDPKQRRPDTTLAKKHLNWEAEVSLEDGLKKMSEWTKMKLSSFF